jgi:hypothetical protein
MKTLSFKTLFELSVSSNYTNFLLFFLSLFVPVSEAFQAVFLYQSSGDPTQIVTVCAHEVGIKNYLTTICLLLMTRRMTQCLKSKLSFYWYTVVYGTNSLHERLKQIKHWSQ